MASSRSKAATEPLLDPAANPECDHCGNELDPEYDRGRCSSCGAPLPDWKKDLETGENPSGTTALKGKSNQ